MTVDQFVRDVIDSIPQSIVGDDGTREVIEELARVWAYVEQDTDTLREALPNLLSADDCPLSMVVTKRLDGTIQDTGYTALDGLLSLIGFDPAVTWIRNMTTVDKRKLALVAASLWKSKGTPDGTRALCRMLGSGNDVVIWDWPFWRYVEGGDVPILVWPDPLLAGETHALLHLSDPYTETDRDRVARGLGRAKVGAMKPGIDTWDLVWCLLADPFLQGLYQYEVTGTPTCEPGDGEVVLAAGDGFVTDFGVETTEWTVNRLLSSFKWDAVAGTVDFRLAIIDPTNYYRVRFTPTQVQVDWVRGASALAVCSGAFVSAPDVWYYLDVRVWELVSGYQIDVLVDGNLICSGVV